MAEIKSHEFDRFINRASELYRIFVIYGPDRGLVSERAREIVAKAGVDTSDPFSLLKLEVSDLQGDPGRLLDEVNSLGLFGGSKLVWLKGAMNEKPLLDALQVLVAGAPPENILVIEAGDLKKGAGLRKVAEPAKSVAVIPCYADDTRALNGLIDAELGQEGLRLSQDGRERLLELLGGDRIASRNEVRKLALYCRGQGTVTTQHVDDIIGDASNISADQVVDAVIAGDLDGLHRGMQKVLTSKTPVFLVLQACLRQLQMLDQMRAEMAEKKLPSSQVMMTLGRHVHFKRKALVERALNTWSPASLSQEMQRLQNAVLQSRQNAVMEPSIAVQTLLATALRAGR